MKANTTSDITIIFQPLQAAYMASSDVGGNRPIFINEQGKIRDSALIPSHRSYLNLVAIQRKDLLDILIDEDCSPVLSSRQYFDSGK